MLSQQKSSESHMSATSSSSSASKVERYAENVLDLLTRRETVEVIIGTKEDGKYLTSNLDPLVACDRSSCITSLTEKAKVLIRKLLNEELNYVRIKGTKNEIIVTYDDYLEIITIQNDSILNK